MLYWLSNREVDFSLERFKIECKCRLRLIMNCVMRFTYCGLYMGFIYCGLYLLIAHLRDKDYCKSCVFSEVPNKRKVVSCLVTFLVCYVLCMTL